MRKIVLAGWLVVAGVTGGWAQSNGMEGTGAASTPASKVSLASANDAMLTVFEQQFVAAAKAMPAEKYSFTPFWLQIAGSKFYAVRTFAGQVKHVAEANYYFYGAVSGMKTTADVKAIEALTSKDDILAALAKSFVFAHKAMASLTEANQSDPLDIDGMKTKGTVAVFAVAHGFDHYGQMVEYLRMNGVMPPGSK